MPRNGGRPSSAAPRSGRSAESTPVTPLPADPQPVNPLQAPKVVAMGAIPENRRSASNPARRRSTPQAPAKLPLKLKAQTPNTKPKTKTPAKAPAKFPVPPKAQAPRQRPTASQRRSDDRTMLSGAIRAPHGSEPVEPKLKGKANTEDSKPIPARSFSGRLLVLSLVLAVFAVMLVPTIGIYTRQRAEISDLRASIADKQVEQQELKDQIARWDDPLYIKQQARDRINLVMPGERNYMVIGSSATSPEAEPVNESPEQVRTDLPWVDALWDTVQRAATD
ncbi:hypothetical protein GCM10023166_25670 [Paeniglutamicibacter cryotolerans]